ncbi:MAG: putative lipid II flippase FtsW [Propionibacteriaceae bacterium]|nr:putative lipid II flippase FtsW [Propionibacteriaceae bacterium]
MTDNTASDQPDQSLPKRNLLRAASDHPLFDYRLVVATSAVLLCLGLLMVISSSSVVAAVEMEDPFYFGKRQIIFAVIGVAGAWILSLLPEKFMRFMTWPAIILALLLLLATFTGLGVEQAGNQNWLSFGPSWTQFQPSEFAKLAIILWGANDLARRGKILTDIRQWTVFIVLSFTIIGLVVIQKDQGTAMIMMAIVILVLVGAGAPWRLLFGILTAAIAAVVILIVLQPYRMRRIWAFMNPEEDVLGSNLQARRGIYALASGGWFGQGLGSSRQKWGLLMEAHNDYIFAIIGEELGLMGTLGVILLFGCLAYAGIRIAMKSTSSFSRLLAVGVVAWFTVQAFANIAVATRLIPVMGITLPMISYGGSSLMANLFALGLLAGCARREPAAQKLLASRKHKPRVATIVRANR